MELPQSEPGHSSVSKPGSPKWRDLSVAAYPSGPPETSLMSDP